jgi:hypothetical protein
MPGGIQLLASPRLRPLSTLPAVASLVTGLSTGKAKLVLESSLPLTARESELLGRSI